MPCDQQSSKALISGFEGKSTCSGTLTLNGSCEVRQCLRKLARARSKAEQTISKCSMLHRTQQDGH